MLTKDQDWNYLIRLSGSAGKGDAATGFEQLAYTNSLLVALQEIIDLDLQRFSNEKIKPAGNGNLRYDQASITYQPTGETVAITHHYPPGTRYFPGGPGLYLQITAPMVAVEQTLGIGLAPMRSPLLRPGYLLLGTYDLDQPKRLVIHEGVDQVSDTLMEKRWDQGQGIFQLEIEKQTSHLLPGAAITYHFDHLKDGLLALTNQDLSAMHPTPGGQPGPDVSTMRLSWFAEPLIEVERHPHFLAFPITGTPGIYYTVPSKDSLKFLSEHIDLGVLPHFEQGKDYFQVAAYQQNGLQLTATGAFEQLRQQLDNRERPTVGQTADRFVLEFQFQMAPGEPAQIGRAHYDQSAAAIKTLVGLPPSTFDLEGATAASPRLQRAYLHNVSKGEVMATMFKAKEGENGLPGGIYLVLDKSQLTAELISAMGPTLSETQMGGSYHFLLPKPGELASLQRKHSDQPRTLTENNGPVKHR